MSPGLNTHLNRRFEFRGVSKYYRGKNRHSVVRALENVDLTIYDGKINALVGPSGCGKSTVARLLVGLEAPSRGLIFYKNQPLRQVPPRQLRNDNQLMFQNPLLSVNPCFRVGQILADPLVVRKKSPREIREKIAELLDILEIPTPYLDKYPSELSGGQLQRIVLARTLAPEPEFLVLDEPFSALDEIMAGRLTEYFKTLFARLDIGVLLISHHPGRVGRLADTTITL